MVGHAFMGRAHSNAFRQAGRFFDLPAQIARKVVVGRDLERAAAAAARLGWLEGSDDLDAVLARDDIHVVDVATPNDSHFEVATKALRAKKHVLCEKPLAMTLDEARQMQALAKKAGVRVGIWHNYRRTPAASLAQRLIARGEIGDVRQVRAVYLQDWMSGPETGASWRTSKKRCGSGAHGDLNAHLVDMTLFLTGLVPSAVVGTAQTFTKKRKGASGKLETVDVDDAFAFLARFPNGAVGTYEATRVAPGRKNFNQIEIGGTKGSLLWSFERMNELQLFSFADAKDAQGFRTIMCMDPAHPYAASWWPDGHVLGYEHGFVHQVVDFVRAVHDGSEFHPDFADGVKVMAVLEAALQSVEQGRWIEVQS
jgi:predicted dehydrogenase